ncbi:hypothetical protein V1T75_08935 [Tenacibaculum sp. FZY0031]|uniref:hypothetical protein n=1 Tax=Tenacibaculum sp. FZY0031 TaxID=3116648 RepID=UPI002ECD2EA9|nr:hypothetical protein [Tenacibaculum sp. FZY0031]
MKFLTISIFSFLVLSTTNIFSQSLNDYRTIASGNWTTTSIWEVYNGVAWIPATTYPGQVAGTNDVTISNGATVTINSAISNTINSVTIGDRTGTPVIETLSITGTSSINTLEFNIAYDGLLRWDANVSLSLTTNASFFIENSNPDGLTLGTDHGIYINPAGCNVQKILYIGTTRYTNCNGGGPNPKPLTFNEANNNGGNLGVAPTSNTPVCSGQTVNLFANPSGTDAGSASYTWTVTSSPVAYTFSSTNENPTDSPTIVGTYIYEVTATSGAISNTNTVSVEIISCNKRIITNRRITYRVNK